MKAAKPSNSKTSQPAGKGKRVVPDPQATTLRGIQKQLASLQEEVAAIKAGPVDRFVAKAVVELEEGSWGEVLTELKGLDESPDGRSAQDLLDQLLMTRGALMAALGIRPFPAESRLRLSAAKLKEYRWADHRTAPRQGRHSFEVISPGWKRGEVLLLMPKIRLLETKRGRRVRSQDEAEGGR